MSHKTHAYLMIGLLAAGAVLFASGGVGGGTLFLLWPLLCVGMMLAMLWSMGGMFRRPTDRPKVAEHTHADGVTHVHDVPAVPRR